MHDSPVWQSYELRTHAPPSATSRRRDGERFFGRPLPPDTASCEIRRMRHADRMVAIVPRHHVDDMTTEIYTADASRPHLDTFTHRTRLSAVSRYSTVRIFRALPLQEMLRPAPPALDLFDRWRHWQPKSCLSVMSVLRSICCTRDPCAAHELNRLERSSVLGHQPGYQR